MAVTTTTTLSNSVQAKYLAAYILKAKENLYYDQMTYVVAAEDMIEGSSLKVTFYFNLPPNPNAVSQQADITPKQVADALFSVTPDLYGDAVMIPEKLRRTAFTKVAAAVGEIIGQAAGESVDYLARTAATQGKLLMYAGSATTRATCDHTSDQIAYGDFVTAAAMLAGWHVDPIANGNYGAVLSHAVFKDLLEDGTIVLVGEYGQKPQIILNGELGMVGGVKLVVTQWAKKFYGSGTANSSVSQTLSVDKKAGATTISLAADTNVAVGQWITIGTVESAAVEYPTTEIAKIVAGSASPWTIVGGGINGGLKYFHGAGESVVDNDTVHAVVFFGKNSIGKVYSPEDGAMGRALPPKTTGLLDQFETAAWKFFGGYGRVAENRLLRMECATSLKI